MSGDKTMTYTYNEAYEASLAYFKGDELAASVFVSKYALRNSEGNILEKTPTDMHLRLTREFARIESKYPNPLSDKEIFCLLADVDHLDVTKKSTMTLEQLAAESRGMGAVVPQGSPMSAMGNPYKLQSLSNCFVIASPQDSYGGILFTDQEQAQIMKRRGGVGFDVSTIRPKGLATANAAGTTDGIGVFMERFSNTCREVAQGGRRGALMLTISVMHPEVETFINIKRDLKKVTGANISIRLTDEFMNAVKDDTDFTLRWPVESTVEEAKVTKVVKARELWNQVIDAAWTSAEPGLLFWDTVKKMTPTEAYASKGYANVSTNPCAELILSPYDSCRLLLINLTKFVKDAYLATASFDFEKFKKVSAKAQKLMDDLVDLEIEAVDAILGKINSDPESEEVKQHEVNLWQKIKKAASGARRTGLGITGIGDALASAGVTYGSEDSVNKTEEIYKTLALSAYRSSVDMARDRGSFPVYEWELENQSPFLKKMMQADESLFEDWKKYGRRNIALTTTAPAGSVSCLTQTTSGIEPAYLLSYTRRKKINPNDTASRVDFIDQLGDKWQEYKVYHHGFKKWMDVTGKTDEQITESAYWKATSNDVDWPMSVKLQAAAQRWICHAISKTCNLPNDVTHEVVAEVYMKAWEAGCKGFTVYRDGCRTGVLVQDTPKETKQADSDSQPETLVENHAPKRPKELPCDIHRINVKGSEGQESYLVLVGSLDGKPYEIFCGRSSHVEVPKKAKTGILIKNGKKDGVATYNLQIPVGDDDQLLFKDIVELFANPNHGAFTRTLSLGLRHGVPVQYIVEQLQKDKYSDMQSFSRVLARVLKSYIPDGVKATSSDKTCTQCSSDALVYKEGCVTCSSCGWSKC
jgi:ribonucleoside-diphosphate reductase alpha chain